MSSPTRKPQRTATVYRHYVWGTSIYLLRLCYGPYILAWAEDGKRQQLDEQDENTPEQLQKFVDRARALGYTHIKFDGDWTGREQPKRMKL